MVAAWIKLVFLCIFIPPQQRHQQTKDKHILHSMLLKESEIELFYTADIQIITTTVQVSVSLQMTLGVEWQITWELRNYNFCLCNCLRARECEISPSLDINTLLCKEGISCGRLEGRDRGTVLFKAAARQSTERSCLKADCVAKALTEQFINCELSVLKLSV